MVLVRDSVKTQSRPKAGVGLRASAFSSNPWTPYKVKGGVCRWWGVTGKQVARLEKPGLERKGTLPEITQQPESLQWVPAQALLTLLLTHQLSCTAHP